jgi:hypothetical protein
MAMAMIMMIMAAAMMAAAMIALPQLSGVSILGCMIRDDGDYSSSAHDNDHLLALRRL